MTNEELQGVIDQVDDALRARDEQRLAAAAYDFETAAMASDDARETLARALVTWLGTPELRDAPGSWHLLSAMRHDFERLAPDTQRALAEALLDAYGRMTDPMGTFTISDVLGRVGSAEALAMLEERAAAGLSPEHLLPNAFERFVRSATALDVAQRALANLRRLTGHESEEVRGEAFLSLYRLSRNAPEDIAAAVAATVAAVERETGVSFQDNA